MAREPLREMLSTHAQGAKAVTGTGRDHTVRIPYRRALGNLSSLARQIGLLSRTPLMVPVGPILHSVH